MIILFQRGLKWSVSVTTLAQVRQTFGECSAPARLSAVPTRARARVPTPSRPAHRPLKLTSALQRSFCNAIERGVPFRTACMLVDVAETTAYEWMRRGGHGEWPFERFAMRVRRARARCVIALVRLAAQDGPSGARWLLERRFPEHFAPRRRIGSGYFVNRDARGFDL